MVDQAEIHKLMQSKDLEERNRAVEELKNNFFIFKDKEQAWDDLVGLTQDKDEYVRSSAANALGDCYSHIPDEYRKQAWDDLHRLTQDKNKDVRMGIAYALGGCYSQIPDEYRKQAWDDLHRLTQDNNDNVRSEASYALGDCYSQIPDEYRKQAWDDLNMLTQDKNKDFRIAANHSSGRVSIYRASKTEGDESIRSELETALRFLKNHQASQLILTLQSFVFLFIVHSIP